MKLILRIENLDSLPDGGPLEFSAVARGFEVGPRFRDGLDFARSEPPYFQPALRGDVS